MAEGCRLNAFILNTLTKYFALIETGNDSLLIPFFYRIQKLLKLKNQLKIA